MKESAPPGLPVIGSPGVPDMPTSTRTDRGDLRLTLSNGSEVIDVQIAATPQEANRVAIMMLASRDALNHGDALTVRHAEEESPAPA
jgi:hypothetical protein